jgi:hypothetical protein
MPKRKIKKSKLAIVHHSLAIFYYVLMISIAVFGVIFVSTVVIPLVDQFTNSTAIIP